MKAVITRNFRESIDCGDGIIKTFYIMLGGRKDPENVKEMIITDDADLFETMKTFETINNNKIKKEKKRGGAKPLDEIKLDLEVISNILFYSYDLLNDAKASWRETFGGDAPEEYFFNARMGYTHWGMCVIELSKLFTNSHFQQFNLYSLLDRIDEYKNTDGVIAKVKSINTQKYRDLLRIYEDEKILEYLKIIRDKVFAHTDKAFYTGSTGIELDYINLERLQSTTFNILKELNEVLLNLTLEEYKPNTAVESILKLINREIKGITD